jgi:hypothetical protein
MVDDKYGGVPFVMFMPTGKSKFTGKKTIRYSEGGGHKNLDCASSAPHVYDTLAMMFNPQRLTVKLTPTTVMYRLKKGVELYWLLGPIPDLVITLEVIIDFILTVGVHLNVSQKEALTGYFGKTSPAPLVTVPAGAKPGSMELLKWPPALNEDGTVNVQAGWPAVVANKVGDFVDAAPLSTKVDAMAHLFEYLGVTNSELRQKNRIAADLPAFDKTAYLNKRALTKGLTLDATTSIKEPILKPIPGTVGKGQPNAANTSVAAAAQTP